MKCAEYKYWVTWSLINVLNVLWKVELKSYYYCKIYEIIIFISNLFFKFIQILFQVYFKFLFQIYCVDTETKSQ